MYADQVRDIEKKIVQRLIADALAQGFTLSVNDGEQTVLTRSTDADAIEAAMFSTGEDYLCFAKEGKYVGVVQLVYGNDGYDVIADNHTSLERALEGVTRYAETFETA
jgi:hypothetical protein